MGLSVRLLAYMRDSISGSTRLFHLAYAYISYVRSFLRVASYIRERHEGRRPLASAKRVAVFVHYDRRGRVHEFVQYHLRLLANSGYAVVFVSNAPVLPAAAVERLKPVCALILRRKNIGYDFGAYKEGIEAIPDIGALDSLLLVNDSVYGPLHHPVGILERMPAEEADVWGASDSWERSFHLQSYFLLFHRAALTNPAFSTFWKGLRYVQSKTWIIEKYEIGLSRALSRAGLRCRAAYPYRRAAAALIEAMVERGKDVESLDPARKTFLQQIFRNVDQGIPLNSTHFFWDYMIVQMGFPFLKRDLLQRNPARIPLVSYWERVLRQSTEYDPDLILRHLEQSLRNRSV